jgi:hypothetical protein
MASAVIFRGSEGIVRWGYHQAVRVGSWTMTGDGGGGTLTASIVSMDSFKASQRPLKFVVVRPGTEWVWPVDTLQITDTTLHAVLGPVE